MYVVSSKRNKTAIWSGIFAAASGMAVAVIAWQWKHAQNSQHLGVTKRLRNIQSLLSDCHKKINEIETHLPDAVSVFKNTTQSV